MNVLIKRSFGNSIIGGPVRDPKVIRYSFEQASFYMRNVLQPKIFDMKVGSMKMSLKYRKRFQGMVLKTSTSSPTAPSSSGSSMTPCIQNGIIATMMDHCTGACAWTCLTSPDLFVNTVDLEVQFLETVPCEDITFEAEVTDIGPKLIVVDGACWNKARTAKLATARGLFNIYKNPQPLLHSVFRFFVNKFGRPLLLSSINPVVLLNLMKFFQKKKK